MDDPLILYIETATDRCSVALAKGKELLASAESGPERSHARLLNRFIRTTLSDAGKKLQEIDAVAVGKGPGSYTGLRIGVSTAKGIAYALEKPILSTGTLVNMAYGAVEHPEVLKLRHNHGNRLILCSMLDARRMEVYSEFFSFGLEPVREVSADIIEPGSYKEILENHPVCFFGNGSEKCSGVLEHPHALFIDNIHPSARNMVKPVLDRFRKEMFEDVAYFEPFYLKDFIATAPKKKVI